MAEWERHHRKHSDEEKPAEAVQGILNILCNNPNRMFFQHTSHKIHSFFNYFISSQGSVFICFDTEESSKQFLERSDIKTFKDNEMLVLSR